MAIQTQQSVVILYEHALLGEGIAKYLRVQAGVEATVASSDQPDAVAAALALNPAVVIFELSDPARQVDLSSRAPDAVLIDVSAVITRGSVTSPCTTRLERILQAVLDSVGVALPDQFGASLPVPDGIHVPEGMPIPSSMPLTGGMPVSGGMPLTGAMTAPLR